MGFISACPVGLDALCMDVSPGLPLALGQDLEILNGYFIVGPLYDW